MMAATKRQGLRPRLIEWLEANPGELLHETDIAAKFNVSRLYARNVLSILKAEGVATKITGYMLKRSPQ